MTVINLFFEFFKIGLFTFGGGQAMIPLIRDAVLKFGWLEEAQFYDFIGVCESTPGPIAINMATFIGAQNAGLWGSIFATLGVVLPSFLIILLVASILKNFTENRFVKGFLWGVGPVVAALITATGIILLAKSIGFYVKEFSFDLSAAICFVLTAGIFYGAKFIFKKKVSAVVLILVSAVLGLVLTPIFG